MAMTGHTTPSSISQVQSTLFTMTYGYQRSLTVAVWRYISCHHSMSFRSCSRHLHTVDSVILVMRVSSFLIRYHTNHLWAMTVLIYVTFAIPPIFSFLILSFLVFPLPLEEFSFPGCVNAVLFVCAMPNAPPIHHRISYNCLEQFAFHLHIITLS